MQVYAVQTILQGSAQPAFVLVAADDPVQGLAFAAKQSIDEGRPETAMVAVFDKNEIESLLAAMKQASENIER